MIEAIFAGLDKYGPVIIIIGVFILILLFMINATFIITGLTFYKPQYTLPGLIITLAGIPIYNFRDKIRRKKLSQQ